jgi:hypothetical protein
MQISESVDHQFSEGSSFHATVLTLYVLKVIHPGIVFVALSSNNMFFKCYSSSNSSLMFGHSEATLHSSVPSFINAKVSATQFFLD